MDVYCFVGLSELPSSPALSRVAERMPQAVLERLPLDRAGLVFGEVDSSALDAAAAQLWDGALPSSIELFEAIEHLLGTGRPWVFGFIWHYDRMDLLGVREESAVVKWLAANLASSSRKGALFWSP